MTIAIATGNGFLDSTVTGGAALTRAFTNNVAAGSLLVATVIAYTATDSVSVSDGVNGAWTKAVERAQAGLGTVISIHYFYNAGAGATTVTVTGHTASAAVIVTEYTGALSASSPIDGTASAAQGGGSSMPDSGAINSTAAGLIYGTVMTYPSASVALGAGFTSGSTTTAPSAYPARTQYILAASAGANNVVSGDTAESYWIALGVAFKAAATGVTSALSAACPAGTLSASSSAAVNSTLTATCPAGTLSATSTVLASITSEPLTDNAGNVLASTALDYVAVYNATTGALVARVTGLSTNAAGRFVVGHASLVAGTSYRVDWQTSTGKRRMPLAAAA